MEQKIDFKNNLFILLGRYFGDRAIYTCNPGRELDR